MEYQIQHSSHAEYFRKETGQDFNYQYHLHKSFELIIILSGEMMVDIGEKEFFVKKGEAVLIFPNQLHSLRSLESKHVLFIFSPDLVKAYSNAVAKKMPISNLFKIDDYLKNKLVDLDEGSSTIQKKGLLYLVCAEFDKSAKYISKELTEERLLYKILEFIDNNYSGECTLQKLTKEVGYSYSYLSRFIKGELGCSFGEYVNQFKVNEACYRLTNTLEPILKISEDCGFQSLRNFNRVFKECTGVSPKKYRSEHSN